MEQRLLQLKEKYALQYSLFCLEKQLEEKREAVKYALYEKREADARAREYRGSLKSLLHGITGKREEEEEHLSREKRAAEAKLKAEKRELTSLELRLQQTKERLEQIPEMVPSDDPEWQKGAAKIRAKHLLRGTLTLSDEAVLAMEIARGKEQPQLRMGSTLETIAMARYQPQEAANALAKKIRGNVEVLNECLAVLGEKPIELGPYFYGPEAYLVTAFQYGVLDQMNKAMDQMRMCRQTLRHLLENLE